jgi:hypothetical protein
MALHKGEYCAHTPMIYGDPLAMVTPLYLKMQAELPI